MMELTAVQWVVIFFSALTIGIAKTGLPGIGILVIPLMAAILPARASTGFVLPMLIMADLFAVVYYRRKAVWSHLLRLVPWAAAGIVIGWMIMDLISDEQLQPVIGAIVLALLGFNVWRRHRAGADEAVPHQLWFAAGIGLLAGVTTMLANAAGPIMVVYLVAMRLPKTAFIGTGAWYFFLLNWFKVPFSADLGLINRQSLAVNLVVLPVIALGAVAGVLIVKRIPQRGFSITVEILAALAAMKLLLA